jgi:hypothetical protein
MSAEQTIKYPKFFHDRGNTVLGKVFILSAVTGYVS